MSTQTDLSTSSTTGLFAYSELADSWVVRATKPVSYEIRFVDHLLDPQHIDLAAAGGGTFGRSRRFVVVDANVDVLYGDSIRSYFDHHGIDCALSVVPADETVKDFETAARVVREIDAFGIARRTEPIIVIGGGVLMDIVGLVGSLYRRGTPFVRVPTTLIGLVDAGVGAKTGVNFNGHKNRLGTYFPADLTLLDPAFLATVDRRHIGNGLAEILKIALVKDRKLFELLAGHGARLLTEKFQGNDRVGDVVLRRAIQGMLEELQPNLWEAKLERCVDYGHTFSPTVEMHALPQLLHGEAVAVDMALTTVISAERGLVSREERDRIFTVLRQLELPSWDPHLKPELLARALDDTIRHRDGLQRLPLPVGIGDVTFVNDVTPEEIASALPIQREIGSLRG